MNILALPEQDRPREKLRRLGAEALTDAELLALLLGSGTQGTNAVELAQKTLLRLGTGDFKSLSGADLSGIRGLGEGKKCLLLALGEICARSARGQRPLSLLEAAKRLSEHIADVEEAYVFRLGPKEEVVSTRLIARGSKAKLIVCPAEVLRGAVGQGGTRFALVHSHPGGLSFPSREDLAATQQVSLDARSLGLELFDHLIVNAEEVFSFRQNGLIPRKP